MINRNRTGRRNGTGYFSPRRAAALDPQEAYGRHCSVLAGKNGYPARDLMIGYQAEHPGAVIDRGMVSALPRGRHQIRPTVVILDDLDTDDFPTLPLPLVVEPPTAPIRVPRALLAAFAPVPQAAA